MSQDELPLAATWADREGCSSAVFDLVGTNITGVSGPVRETVQFTKHGTRPGGGDRGTFELLGELPRLPQNAGSAALAEVDQANSPWWVASTAVEALIDRHISFVNTLRDSVASDPDQWEGETHEFAVRPLARTLQVWREHGDVDQPTMSLIVKLARDLPDLVESVCARPRRVLGRERQMLPVGRVQELDAGCLRWLAHQPGRGVAEKAGAKQRVLGVARVELVDTPENRVLKDFLRRGATAAERYGRENREFPNHPRVKSVGRFGRLLQHQDRFSAVAEVTALNGAVQPNYVLQHDQRYREIWHAYVQLVRQQRLEDQIWRWRQRLWVEECGLALLAAVQRSACPGPADRSDVLIRSEHYAGQFISHQSHMAPFVLHDGTGTRTVTMLMGRSRSSHPAYPPTLERVAPHYVLRVQGHGEDRWIVVRCLLDFGIQEHRLKQHVASLHKELAELSSEHRLSGVVLLPHVNHPAFDTAVSEAFVGRCCGTRVTLPIQRQLDTVEKVIAWKP